MHGIAGGDARLAVGREVPQERDPVLERQILAERDEVQLVIPA